MPLCRSGYIRAMTNYSSATLCAGVFPEPYSETVDFSGLERALLGSIEASIPGSAAFICSKSDGAYKLLSHDEQLSVALIPELQGRPGTSKPSCDWAIRNWSGHHLAGGSPDNCTQRDGRGWILEVVHSENAASDLIAGCVGKGAAPSTDTVEELATLLRAQLLVLAELRIRNEELVQAERKNRDFQARLAEKQQPLSRLNTRFCKGFWDWELGDDSQWYSDPVSYTHLTLPTTPYV